MTSASDKRNTEVDTRQTLQAVNADTVIGPSGPIFAATSSMTPVVPSKGQDTGTDQWKISTINDTPNTMHLELSQGYVAGPEAIYYVPQEYMNGFGPSVFPEHVPNGEINNSNSNQEPESPQNEELSLLAKESVPLDELKRLVRHQFEYYFSRENLANDAYLVSQMDSDSYVPISTVAKFNQIKKLTSDIGLVVEALKESPYIQLDENCEKVRANMKRCIVILREIPESTPVEEVKALFQSEKCPKWTHCEFAHNNSWYITFESEVDAQVAYKYLREEVQTFQGKPIMARIKAKTLLSRTVFLPKTPQNGIRPVVQNEPSQPQPQQPPPPPPPPPQSQPQNFTQSHPQPFSQSQPQHFTQSQLGGFTVPAAPVFSGQQTFPTYYPPGTIVQTTFINPRQQFFPQEVRHRNAQFQTNNFSKPSNKLIGAGTSQRPFFPGGKPRPPPKTFIRDSLPPERNNLDKDDRPQIPFRRPAPLGIVNGPNIFRKEEIPPRYSRQSNPRMKRAEEVVPRFQRLKQEREKRFQEEQARKEEDNLTLDLAPENFPALPSPSSPNEKTQNTTSLKELATNALKKAGEQEEKDNRNDSSSSYDDISPVSSVSPLPFTPTTSVDTAQSLGRLSYAQMAQKPIPKAPPPPSLPNEKSNNNNSNGTKVNVQTAQSEQGNNQRTKNDSSESDSEKGILKDLLSATIENASNISPKPQRQRQTRIASDPGERESFQSGISPRSNSYHGQSTAGRESYAAKSANLPQQNPPKSPSLRHKNQPPRPSSAPPKPQSQLQIQGNSASQVVNQSWTGIQINNKSVGNNNSFNKSQRGPVRRARSGESGFDSSEESAVKSGQAFKREERNSREGRK